MAGVCAGGAPPLIPVLPFCTADFMASFREPASHHRTPPAIMARVRTLAEADTEVGRLIARMITLPESGSTGMQPEGGAPFGRPYLAENSADLSTWQDAFFFNLCNVVAWEDSSKKSIVLACSHNDHIAARLATHDAKQCHLLVELLLAFDDGIQAMTNEAAKIKSLKAVCQTCRLADHGPGRPAAPYRAGGQASDSHSSQATSAPAAPTVNSSSTVSPARRPRPPAMTFCDDVLVAAHPCTAHSQVLMATRPVHTPCVTDQLQPDTATAPP